MSYYNQHGAAQRPLMPIRWMCVTLALAGTLAGCGSTTDPTAEFPDERIAPASPDLWAAIRDQSPLPLEDVKLIGVLDRDQTETERRVVYFVGDEQVEYAFTRVLGSPADGPDPEHDSAWQLQERVAVHGTRPAPAPIEGRAEVLPGYPNTIARVWDEYGWEIEEVCNDPGITGPGQYQCPGWINYGWSNPHVGHGTFYIDTVVVDGWEYKFELGPFTYWDFFGPNGLESCYTVSCWFGAATDVYFSFFVEVNEHNPPSDAVWISQGPTQITVAGNYWWEVDAAQPVWGSSWQYRELGTSSWGAPPAALNPNINHAILSLTFEPGANESFQLRAKTDQIWTDPYTVTVADPLPSPPLTLFITGDNQVAPGEECAWQAFADGGYPPYSYTWGGGLSGSTQTIFGSLPQSSSLWVQVTDSDSNTKTAQMFVEVDESYMCEF